MKIFKKMITETTPQPLDLASIYTDEYERLNHDKIDKKKTTDTKSQILHLTSIYTEEPERYRDDSSGKTSTRVNNALAKYNLGQIMRRKIDQKENNASGNSE